MEPAETSLAGGRSSVVVAVLAVVQHVRQPYALDVEVAASVDLVDHLVHLVRGGRRRWPSRPFLLGESQSGRRSGLAREEQEIAKAREEAQREAEHIRREAEREEREQWAQREAERLR